MRIWISEDSNYQMQKAFPSSLEGGREQPVHDFRAARVPGQGRRPQDNRDTRGGRILPPREKDRDPRLRHGRAVLREDGYRVLREGLRNIVRVKERDLAFELRPVFFINPAITTAMEMPQTILRVFTSRVLCIAAIAARTPMPMTATNIKDLTLGSLGIVCTLLLVFIHYLQGYNSMISILCQCISVFSQNKTRHFGRALRSNLCRTFPVPPEKHTVIDELIGI